MTAQETSAARVLVVEDNAEIRDLVSHVLAQEGYEVLDAENGRQALDVIESGSAPGLILLDLRMPVMNGWEFLAELRKSPYKDIPVVAMSATQIDWQERASFTDSLNKPLDVDRLLQVVQRAVAKKS